MYKTVLLACIFVAFASNSQASAPTRSCKSTAPGTYVCEFTNEADRAIASVAYSITVTGTGREVPWLQTQSEKYIPGGLEPGETISITIWNGILPDRADPNQLEWKLDNVIFYGADNFPIEYKASDKSKQIPSAAAESIKRCLVVDVTAPPFTVSLTITSGTDGKVVDVQPISGSRDSAGFKAASKAVIRCSSFFTLEPNTEYAVTFNSKTFEVK
jgi:hypothetical protein